MSKVKCESCGRMFDRDKTVEKFDKQYDDYGAYDYLFLFNNFCFDCAVDIYEEDENEGMYSDGSDCSNCQSSLSGGSLVMPWEDGDNPNAYVICPNCRTKNLIEGYGND